MEKQTLSRRFAERLDALGAQRFLDHAALLHNRNLLQVRFERAVGCVLRERALVSEGGCFTAGVTLSHVMVPFLTMIPMLALSLFVVEGPTPFLKGTRFYHTKQPSSI